MATLIKLDGKQIVRQLAADKQRMEAALQQGLPVVPNGIKFAHPVTLPTTP